MIRAGLPLAAALLIGGGGCFSAQGGAQRNHDEIRKGMHKEHVHHLLGKPKEVLPIPGQGESSDLPTEQWCYVWNYTTGKTLTLVGTVFIGAFFMDFNPYGFEVAFGRDGRVRRISEVGPRRTR